MTEPGLYDLSRIKYTLLKERNKAPAVIVHSMHERLFMEVTTEKNFSKPHKPVVVQPKVSIEADLLA